MTAKLTKQAKLDDIIQDSIDSVGMQQVISPNKKLKNQAKESEKRLETAEQEEMTPGGLW